jgi:hypothetical protein
MVFTFTINLLNFDWMPVAILNMPALTAKRGARVGCAGFRESHGPSCGCGTLRRCHSQKTKRRRTTFRAGKFLHSGNFVAWAAYIQCMCSR